MCMSPPQCFTRIQRGWGIWLMWLSWGGGRHADSKETDTKSCVWRTQIWMFGLVADFIFLFFVCHVLLLAPLCLYVPEMTTSQTLWVKRLTVRPAAVTLERINVQQKTLARPQTPGSLRPTSPGRFSLCCKAAAVYWTAILKPLLIDDLNVESAILNFQHCPLYF